MPDAQKLRLRVTAGPSYDPSTHQLVHVNTPESVHISSKDITADISVRIKNYRGIPSGSPASSPYFEHAPHTSDLYSIAFAFSLPEGSAPMRGDELIFGNDFDHPIRDNLPYGTSTAMSIVKRWIDPGLDGDAYADKPHMYGPLLSSINVLRLDDPSQKAAGDDAADEAAAWSEGGSGAGATYRAEHGIPDGSAARMRHFLGDAHKQDFEFAPGTLYKCDFFNPYLDFNEFAIKLPGFSLGIMGFWDGQPLRYVLKRKRSAGAQVVEDEPLFVVLIALVDEDEVQTEEEKWVSSAKGDASGAASAGGEKKAQGNDDDVD